LQSTNFYGTLRYTFHPPEQYLHNHSNTPANIGGVHREISQNATLIFSSQMKRIFFIIFCMLMFIAVSIALCTLYYETRQTERTVEHIVVSGLTPEKYDLGYVGSKSIHDFTIELTNASNENLQIDRITADCSCITITNPPKIIPANGRLPVHVCFIAPDETGYYTKTILVTAGNNTWKSRIHARIDMPLRVEPKDLVFSTDEEITDKSLTIFNEGKVPVRLLYATSIPAACNAKISAKPIEPNESITISVHLTDRTIDRLISLNIQTNHRHQKKIIVPIRTK
jgi:hypothetical protein